MGKPPSGWSPHEEHERGDRGSSTTEQAVAAAMIAAEPCGLPGRPLTSIERENMILFCFGITQAIVELNRDNEHSPGPRTVDEIFPQLMKRFGIDGERALRWSLSSANYSEGRRIIRLGNDWATRTVGHGESNVRPSLMSALSARSEQSEGGDGPMTQIAGHSADSPVSSEYSLEDAPGPWDADLNAEWLNTNATSKTEQGQPVQHARENGSSSGPATIVANLCILAVNILIIAGIFTLPECRMKHKEVRETIARFVEDDLPENILDEQTARLLEVTTTGVFVYQRARGDVYEAIVNIAITEQTGGPTETENAKDETTLILETLRAEGPPPWRRQFEMTAYDGDENMWFQWPPDLLDSSYIP